MNGTEIFNVWTEHDVTSATLLKDECVNVTTAESNPSIEISAFGKHEFIQTKPGIAIPVIIILSVASFVGTSGNVLTLLAVASSKNLRNVETIFIVNLAISDLYVTSIADPLSIVGKYAFYLFIYLFI